MGARAGGPDLLDDVHDVLLAAAEAGSRTALPGDKKSACSALGPQLFLDEGDLNADDVARLRASVRRAYDLSRPAEDDGLASSCARPRIPGDRRSSSCGRRRASSSATTPKSAAPTTARRTCTIAAWCGVTKTRSAAGSGVAATLAFLLGVSRPDMSERAARCPPPAAEPAHVPTARNCWQPPDQAADKSSTHLHQPGVLMRCALAGMLLPLTIVVASSWSADAAAQKLDPCAKCGPVDGVAFDSSVPGKLVITHDALGAVATVFHSDAEPPIFGGGGGVVQGYALNAHVAISLHDRNGAGANVATEGAVVSFRVEQNALLVGVSASPQDDVSAFAVSRAGMTLGVSPAELFDKAFTTTGVPGLAASPAFYRGSWVEIVGNDFVKLADATGAPGAMLHAEAGQYVDAQGITVLRFGGQEIDFAEDDVAAIDFGAIDFGGQEIDLVFDELTVHASTSATAPTLGLVYQKITVDFRGAQLGSLVIGGQHVSFFGNTDPSHSL